MIDKRLFPFLDPGKHFVRRSWMAPGLTTALCAVALAQLSDRPILFLYLLGIGISAVSYFFIDLLCHERKPFWVAALVVVVSAGLVASPLTPYLLLPFRWAYADMPLEQVLKLPVTQRFSYFFVSAGLAEEFVKAIPVLLFAALGALVPGRLGRHLGVRTPVEGILIGAASGIGFALVETLTEYVPYAISQFQNLGVGMYEGVAVGIYRLVGTMFSHLAWAGYMGYFIGLAASRMVSAWKALLVGWLSAATLHGLWDCFGGSAMASLVIASLSYICLAAAILEARRFGAPASARVEPVANVSAEPAKAAAVS